MSKTNQIIGLGTAAIGRPQYINIRQNKETTLSLDDFKKKGITTLEKAYQQGVRYFDTAPGYGMAEELLIAWLQTKNDPTIHVATKWGYTYTANFDPNATQHEVKEHSLAKLNEQWNTSKSLLPYLKVYQIHSATFESGVLTNEEILQRLFELKQLYGIAIGITTTGSNQIEVLKKALEIKKNETSLFDTFQVTYNILDQNITEITPILRKQKKKLIIKEALANGRLLTNANYPQYNNLYTQLQQLANKYQVGVDAIALRFCMDTLAPFKVLSGGSNPAHINQNLKVIDFELTHNEIETLQSFKIAPAQYWNERKLLSWN